jgi:hypothetical protein
MLRMTKKVCKWEEIREVVKYANLQVIQSI